MSATPFQFTLKAGSLFLECLPFLQTALSPSEKEVSALVKNRTIEIKGPGGEKILGLLSLSRKCCLGKENLMIFFLGPIPFHYDFSDEKVSGMVCQGSRVFPIHDMQLILLDSSGWVIKEGCMWRLDPKIDLKWIRKVAAAPCAMKEEEAIDLTTLRKEGYLDIPEIRFLSAPQKFSPLPQVEIQNAFIGQVMLYFLYPGNIREKASSERVFHGRNTSEEEFWESEFLRAGFTKKGGDYFCDSERIFSAFSHLLKEGFDLYDGSGKKVLFSKGEGSVFLEEEQGGFILKGALDYGDVKIDIKNALLSFQRKQLLCPAGESALALLDFRTIGEKWASFVVDESRAPRLKREQIGEVESFALASTGLGDLALREQIRSLINQEGVFPQEELENFSGTLYPYQLRGVGLLYRIYLAKLPGALLADEMGLGKTVQILAFLSLLNWKKPVLIVAPTSLTFNWRREIARFLPGETPYLHVGEKRVQSVRELTSNRLIVTSLAILRRDKKLFAEGEFGLVILDEAQSIKNEQSESARAMCALKSAFKVAMTGTPIQNRMADLLSIFDFIVPDLLDDQMALEKVRRRVKPFIIRRTKEEIADQLKSKIEQTVYIEMTEEQSAAYHGLITTFKEKESFKAKETMEIFELLLRLRQICCHPRLVKADFEGKSGKLMQLLADLEEIVAAGHKVLIFSQFTQMLGLIREEVIDRKWPFFYLDGGTKNREELVDAFQGSEGASIFLISLKAGGEGLNLTAADYVIIFDPWWNDAAEHQAIARAHRLGQKGVLIARRYVTTGSIEEKILALKERKTLTSDGVIGDGEMPDMNDLLELLDLSPIS